VKFQTISIIVWFWQIFSSAVAEKQAAIGHSSSVDTAKPNQSAGLMHYL